ncbi:MAG: DUF2851 family protein [Ignavibacteria bacterium]|nr:DUF2851 family protein [Ignavibacteria bacterium]
MKEKENYLQKKIHKLISDPSRVFTTVSGKRLQFLSPGYINKEKGPDFREVAILLNGSIIICDCEFHKNASEWNLHNHILDPEYKKVGIHIVFNNDTNLNNEFETLVINQDELPNLDDGVINLEPNEFLDSLDEIQNYALLRLLRKTSDAKILLQKLKIKDAFELSIKTFLGKYQSKKHRPIYNKIDTEELIGKLVESEMLSFLIDIQKNVEFNIPERLFTIMKHRIHSEGSHLRREIILNCLLPLSLAIANEEQRISLFVWFWSTPALNSYGILTRKFKNIPQNFIWQQQGMLEILYSFGKKTKISSNNFVKIGEVLSFFYLGNPPYK